MLDIADELGYAVGEGNPFHTGLTEEGNLGGVVIPERSHSVDFFTADSIPIEAPRWRRCKRVYAAAGAAVAIRVSWVRHCAGLASSDPAAGVVGTASRPFGLEINYSGLRTAARLLSDELTAAGDKPSFSVQIGPFAVLSN